MIELKNFPKLGVRVPVALRRKVKQLVLDLENAGIGFQGDEMTMEAVFAVGALALLAMEGPARLEVFRLRMAELIAMYEAESPRPEMKDPAGEAGGGVPPIVSSQGEIPGPVPEIRSVPGRKGKGKRNGTD